MLFEPRSVAVVGATPKEGKVGNAILKNLKKFRGKVYAVNPSYSEILGFPCYPSLLDAPDVDLAVIAIPAASVLEVVEQCGKKGVKNVVVISAGFEEAGREGAKLEARLVEICRKYGIKLVGPNCLGIINCHNGLNATFSSSTPKPGNIAFLSQSGAFVLAVIEYFNAVGLGFSKIVSLGNKAVLDESDFMEMLADDRHTDVIMLYLEGIENGRKFMEVARKLSKVKPVIALKSGKTDAGARAASSHTGSIAGSYEACAAAFRQSGVINASSSEELFDFARLLAKYQDVDGDVAIVTNSGGPGVMAADAVEEANLRLASFSKETIDSLKSTLPPEANFYNPVDVLGDADAERFIRALECVAADEQVGSIIAILAPTARIDFEKASLFRTEKPVVTCFMGWSRSDFFDPVRAVKALSALYRYVRIKERKERSGRTYEFDIEAIRKAMEKRMPFEILKACGIPAPRYGVVRTADEAVKIADSIGYPVAMKVLSPEIVHKTDVGCVKLDVEREEVRRAFIEIVTRAEMLGDVRIDGVLIQQMIKGGKEVIVGMKRDPSFGPMLMFGLGGIYVEVFRDVTFRIAPVTENDAYEMIREVKSYRLLRGVRGEKPCDIDSIADVILKMSQLSIEIPQIMEMEINPLKVFEDGCYALDFKITCRGGKI
ncbi:acetate--CoA ligase family protein [Archaeoglobus veneficus]|uniref:acetate--CoA ligase (ADP-forming) n=1 Tax=Archaeoglobus veneficus (strain DSM 11195 / SNP6) TaxID=693661 RepID=F2KS73_ARCVS|nr:acetate--CoA ligase [Archaeoglobus veneficus]AEA48012.1 CoA-binding domain protein [Archaeoglobus veneficus SNP6]